MKLVAQSGDWMSYKYYQQMDLALYLAISIEKLGNMKTELYSLVTNIPVQENF